MTSIRQPVGNTSAFRKTSRSLNKSHKTGLTAARTTWLARIFCFVFPISL